MKQWTVEGKTVARLIIKQAHKQTDRIRHWYINSLELPSCSSVLIYLKVEEAVWGSNRESFNKRPPLCKGIIYLLSSWNEMFLFLERIALSHNECALLCFVA